MKMSSINSYIPFKAHFYRVEPATSMLTIQTDNKPYMGEDAYIISDDFLYDKKEPMKKTSQGFQAHVYANYATDIHYHINYLDTRKTDRKNGSDYVVNQKTLTQKANEFLRALYSQPMIHALKSGSATGKIMYAGNTTLDDIAEHAETIEKIKEPTILVTNRFPSIPKNPNILGIIYTNNDVATFNHFSTQLRNGLDICATVYDSKIISRLEELNGKKVRIDVKDDFIGINKPDKLSSPKKFPKIRVPEMRYCSKPLKAQECSPDLMGAKAVNLARLQRLAMSDKADFIVPRFIALPFGCIESILSGNTDKFGRYQENDKRKIDALKRFMEINGINASSVMVRSSFNGEDLPYYPAAGLYDSRLVRVDSSSQEIDNALLYRAIRQVAFSKNKQSTIDTNAKYGINNADIKPGIVIQNKVDADYTFTLYTDDNKGNIKIDLFSEGSGYKKDLVQPHIFTYNKRTGKLSYDSVEMFPSSVTFDERGNIVKCSKQPNDLSKNRKVMALVKRLCKNAMVVEREFKAPQDIEGGLKDNDIYLWQTRNIVG